MAAERLDAADSNSGSDTLSYTVSGAPKRVLVVVTSLAGGHTDPTGVTYGGQAMTLLHNVGVNSEAWIWILDNAGIVAASTTTISVAGWVGAKFLFAASYKNVEQADPAPSGKIASDSDNSGAPATYTTVDVAADDGSVVISMRVDGHAGVGDGTYSWGADLTEQIEEAGDTVSEAGMADAEIASAVTVECRATHSGTPAHAAVISIMLAPAASGSITLVTV